MHCPRCNRDGFRVEAACPACGFHGPPDTLRELDRLTFLLAEMETWREVPPKARRSLRRRYEARRRQVEIELGLRPPPLSPAEIRRRRWEIVCLDRFRAEVNEWQRQGWLRAGSAPRLLRGAQKRAEALAASLGEEPPPLPSDRPADQLRLLDYVGQMLDLVQRRGHFVDEAAAQAARARLQGLRAEVETAAGLRPRPAPATAPPTPPPKPPPPPRPPRRPLTWDRIWQTLLSERTLNVLLFLGAFLLMASATTYVVYNWERLPSAVQLAFIILFTLFFYAAGRFLRRRMGLRASGIAVTAVGSLLVPLDFYAVLLAGEVLPPEQWPWVWLLASAVCLPIYTLTAWRIQAAFFGYLVAVAAGNLACAGLYVLGLPGDWSLAVLPAVALALLALAYRLRPADGPSSWAILSAPFRLTALLAVAVVLPLGMGLWFLGRGSGPAFDPALALSWTLGAALFAYAARREGSPPLDHAAAVTLPVALVLLLRLVFEPLGVEAAWYAPVGALSAPLYLWAGRRWRGSERGRTATGWGLVLMAVAAGWAVLDPKAAAVTHALLAADVALAVRWWERPRALPLVSLLAFSAVTFGMAAAHLEPAELGLGWASLSLLHLPAALGLGRAPAYAARLFAGALALAFLALLPPALLGHEPLLTYALGHWLGLSLWLLWLDRRRRPAGLTLLLERAGPLRETALHWAVALPLPFFATMLYTRFRPVDAWLGVVLSLLAWALVLIGKHRPLHLDHRSLNPTHWTFPWLVVGYGCSLAGPLSAFGAWDQALAGATVLSAAGLYFFSAWAFRAGRWLTPGGLALPLGLLLLLDFWGFSWAQQSVALAVVVAAYLPGGFYLARRRGAPDDFMAPLVAVAHLTALFAVGWGMLFVGGAWPDAERLWAAGGQLVLGAAYGLFARLRRRERWAHVAAWLGVLAGGLIATAYSRGRGSSAFKAALLAVAYVLAERGLLGLTLSRRRLALARVWWLYRRALLTAGWAVSAGAVGLALVRNLAILGGGFVREMWAVAGLLTVTALYAVAARLFRRRVFVWLAGALLIAPWTLLTAWGWFLWPAPPPLPRYALAWAVLAWLQLAFGLALSARRGTAQPGREPLTARSPDYGFPLRSIAHLLLPFALFWGVDDPAVASLTWGLGLGFYLVSALADHRRGLTGWQAARFLYPAMVVLPVWAAYLLYRLAPTALLETYGLLFLAMALPLLAVGRRLRRVDRADALPLYLGAGGVAVVGTLLVISRPPLLALALTFDALLCLLAAWLFREPLWGYPAATLAPAALFIALSLRPTMPVERYGWWFIGLGAVYGLLAWLLRRGRLHRYGLPPLALSFVVIALGLPFSSLDDWGAFWGYSAAAVVIGRLALLLRQPPLTAVSAALLTVPYGVIVAHAVPSPADYGLALFPGVAAALALAVLLDRRFGDPLPLFPTQHPRSWRLGGLAGWWAAPWYAWGYGAASLAVVLSWPDAARLAASLALAALTFAHAARRFRARAWLLPAGGAAQASVLAVLDLWGWLREPGWAALAFLPVTVVTVGAALVVGRVEGWRRGGWSAAILALAAVDLVGGQAAALAQAEPGAAVTVAHGLLLALPAWAWTAPPLTWGAVALGVVGLVQGLAWADAAPTGYPVGLAALALGYGLAGYGLRAAGGKAARLWFRPLEWVGLGLAAVSLVGAAALGLDVGGLLARTLLGQPLTADVYAPQLRMWVWVLSFCGLLYLATAVVRRWPPLGYGAAAMLLAAWGLWWRFFLGMASFQWYAVPAGFYLLGVGWLEWRQGHRSLARWVDRAGMLVWLGTAWWQSLPGVMARSWPYALLMGAEALLLIWWGSARRHKRFLYVGAAAVVLDAVTQAVEPLLTTNRWIVFGLVGALLVGLAILVERNLVRIRDLSVEMRERLEEWE